MRVLKQTDIAQVSGAAPNPLVSVPLQLLNGIFTVANFVLSLPVLLVYRT